MSARPSYRALVHVAGPGLLILAFLARLPAAMAPLGVIMLVSSVTHSFATAGAVTAALGVGAALGGPVVGWLTDRHGQRPVGTIAALVNAGTLAAVVLTVLSGVSVLPMAALAALVGVATPQVGPLIRVRWASILVNRRRDDLMPTAMAYEGAADEASFVAGPALVGVLAIVGVPGMPLLVAAGLAIVAAVPFALHRTAVPGAHQTAAAAPPRTAVPGAARTVVPTNARTTANPRTTAIAQPTAMARDHSGDVAIEPTIGSAGRTRTQMWVALTLLTCVMLAIGMVFGATQTGITALSESTGRPGMAGLIYAILGVGSALAGLATAWLPRRFALTARLPVFAAAMLIGSLSLLRVHSLGSAAVAMAIVGVTAAPLLITVYGLAERISPAGRGGTVMTLLASGTVGGVALGAGVAGPLAQAYGYPGALVVPGVAGVFALVVAALGASRVGATAPVVAEPALVC